MKPLDLDAVRAFVLVAELASFTRAADALDTTQSAVSLKIKRLEAHLGRALLERTPRVVRLAVDGEAFLPAARELLDAHQRALGTVAVEPRRLSIGVSEHVAVPDLPALLTSLHRHDPSLSLEMHLGSSARLLADYDERRFDAAVVRHEPGEDPPREDAVPLFSEALSWLAAPDWAPRAGEPLPLSVLAGPCGVRAAALRALERAGIA
ncbi:LysR family transcriptional regulator, partial [Burkholderia gladioli]